MKHRKFKFLRRSTTKYLDSFCLSCSASFPLFISVFWADFYFTRISCSSIRFCFSGDFHLLLSEFPFSSSETISNPD